ncbi:ABC transporter ATP-binding protein [Lamprobacter modestohalophilus]|uniref:ABC transporter n=1 Tax=Lamprobacter modestohalophilus TaxID=1064514 RepID=A0A9X1B3M9_9GAMM|nr:ABC transporter ATP-binding protein [Lamprobacter modestohalophilus]MCF7979616.1 ABC transporter ATP-binding protein [Chromatiaceae bacterium]MBK1618164.1 ABC transporter [Lamprobacter modestohalophilus]MCF7995470.1 ABC transporter ATP-binding protein [Chromatiaceae bacterium]MCF8004170.1 ABC transporter ATP-binding protein [Chromatiaceae bacterium]MEA1048850.1 ABC transporter ATP-binding protein [Lamprobacter modestohalophilus]
MPALSVHQLSKTYANGLQALNAVDLQVEAGDFFALLGPNGAGKSTLIGIVTSLVRKSGGRVEVFGHDLDREPEAVRANIGVVPQEFNFNLFLPAIEVVLNQAGYFGVPRKEARSRAEMLLRKLDLWDRRETEMRRLSGGMKRRLMIARALVHRPRLVILDEPTAGVDIEIRRTMWGFMREINAEGTTIILTTHYLEEAESLCRNIAIIDHGRIQSRTDIATLLSELDTETFVLNLKGRVCQLPSLGGFVLEHIDESTLEVQISREHTINGLFEALSRNGIEVLSLRNKQNRLEKLFLDRVEAGRGATP